MDMDKELVKELLNLLNTNEDERVSRNKCFDRFASPFGRRLFAYYKTCMAIKKEIEAPNREQKVKMTNRPDRTSFILEITNEPVRYYRRTVLPKAVRPFFEQIVKKNGASTSHSPAA